jgi:hypothetical protein
MPGILDRQGNECVVGMLKTILIQIPYFLVTLGWKKINSLKIYKNI